MNTLRAHTQEALSAFFRWWVGELAALLPAPLRHGFSRRTDMILDLPRGELAVTQSGREAGRVNLAVLPPEARREAVSALLGRRRTGAVILRLGERDVLRKLVSLPLIAEENLSEVVLFEMDRLTPFRPEEVCYAFHIVQRDDVTARLKVALAVARRGVVEERLREAQVLGFAVDRVEAAGDPPLPLSLGVGRDHRQPRRRWSTAALVALCAALGAVAVALPLRNEARLAATLQERVKAVKSEAEAAEALRSEVASRVAQGRFALDRKTQWPLTIEAMNELTRLLPDGSWIFHMQMNGPEVQISGYSPAASDLLRAIEDSPVFRNVTFRSPVTQEANSGLERFHLSAELEKQP